jgi:hypothetical protein
VKEHREGEHCVDSVVEQREAATVHLEAHAGGVARMTHLWIRWAEVAVDSEGLSLAAKSRRTPDEWHPHLGAEFSHGMVSVCAAVFAMEALTLALARLVMPPEIVEKWLSGKPATALRKIDQVLRRSVCGPRGPDLTAEWKTYIDRRNEVVHFPGELRSSVPYDGLNVAVEDRNYSAEAAPGAFDLLVGTDAIITQPKPKLRDWAEGFRGQVDGLRDLRNRSA